MLTLWAATVVTLVMIPQVFRVDPAMRTKLNWALAFLVAAPATARAEYER